MILLRLPLENKYILFLPHLLSFTASIHRRGTRDRDLLRSFRLVRCYLGFVAYTAREYKAIGVLDVPVVGCFVMDI